MGHQGQQADDGGIDDDEGNGHAQGHTIAIRKGSGTGLHERDQT